MNRWAAVFAWLPAAIVLAGCGDKQSNATVVTTSAPLEPGVVYHDPGPIYQPRAAEQQTYYPPAATAQVPVYEYRDDYGYGGTTGQYYGEGYYQDQDYYYDAYDYSQDQYDPNLLPIYVEEQPDVGQGYYSREVSLQFFYESLAPHGNWVRHARYGWVWYPTDVPVDWRPYTYGRWVLTQEYGWMWVSYHTWGWAPFHYGRWAYDPLYGWVWVPGRVWAPAWVAWRAGGDYVGWAPLPPEAIWQPDRGIVFTANISYDRLPPQRWVFVRERYLVAPQVHRHVVVEPRNFTLINVTNNVTNFVSVDNRIVNRSIDVRRIERVARREIRPVRVETVNNVNVLQREQVTDNTVRVFRPRVERVQAGREPAPPREIVERSRQDTQRQIERRRERLQQREQILRERLEREQAEELRTARDVEEVRQRQQRERQELQRMTQQQEQALQRRARQPIERTRPEPAEEATPRTRDRDQPGTQQPAPTRSPAERTPVERQRDLAPSQQRAPDATPAEPRTAEPRREPRERTRPDARQPSPQQRQPSPQQLTPSTTPQPDRQERQIERMQPRERTPVPREQRERTPAARPDVSPSPADEGQGTGGSQGQPRRDRATPRAQPARPDANRQPATVTPARPDVDRTPPAATPPARPNANRPPPVTPDTNRQPAARPARPSVDRQPVATPARPDADRPPAAAPARPDAARTPTATPPAQPEPRREAPGRARDRNPAERSNVQRSRDTRTPTPAAPPGEPADASKRPDDKMSPAATPVPKDKGKTDRD